MKKSTRALAFAFGTVINGFAAAFTFVLWCVVNALHIMGRVEVPMTVHGLLVLMVILILAAVICYLKVELLKKKK